MGDVVPVRVAAERLKVDRCRLSRLLHRADLATATWREQGRWVDVEAVRAALAARRNGNGPRPSVGTCHGWQTASTPPSGPLQRPWPTTSSPPRWPIRALAQRLAEAEDERRELERERRRLAAESERARAEVQRHAVARRAYEQRRAELSAALARAGRDSAGR